MVVVVTSVNPPSFFLLGSSASEIFFFLFSWMLNEQDKWANVRARGSGGSISMHR